MSHKSSRQKIKQAGQVLAWIESKKKGKVKGLLVGVGSQKISVKLDKKLRKQWTGALNVGDSVLIQGVKKEKKGNGVKIKAQELTLLSSKGRAPGKTRKVSAQKIKVGVCQKSNCCRKGATKVLKALKKSVKENHLDQQVEVCSSSCLGRCKSGPVVVSLPKKKKYQNVRPCDVTSLLITNLAS